MRKFKLVDIKFSDEEFVVGTCELCFDLITTEQTTLIFKDEDRQLHEYKMCNERYGILDDNTEYFNPLTVFEIAEWVKAKKFKDFNSLCSQLLKWAMCKYLEKEAMKYVR